MKATLVSTPQFHLPFLVGKSVAEGIIYLARITSEQQENDSYVGLLKYLMREGHWSPFDMLNLVIEVECERDVSRQILRHPFMPQEWSQRYGDATEMLVSTPREARMQDPKDRQNSFPCDDPALKEWWASRQIELLAMVEDTYTQALGKGIAKEVARSILPEGLTSTRMYLNAPVRTWLFYLKSRMHGSTQKEHRVLAFQIKSIIESISPELWQAFKELHLNN